MTACRAPTGYGADWESSRGYGVRVRPIRPGHRGHPLVSRKKRAERHHAFCCIGERQFQDEARPPDIEVLNEAVHVQVFEAFDPFERYPFPRI